MSEHPQIPGRIWAYTGVAAGITLSVAANLASRFIAPDDAPDNWKPSAGMIIAAIVWPLVLYVALEMFARFPWPRAKLYQALRFGPLVFVAFVAGFVSYRHMRHLLLSYGEDGWTASLGPFAVDGLMIMSAGALIAAARAARDSAKVAERVAPVNRAERRAAGQTTPPAAVAASIAPTAKLHVVVDEAAAGDSKPKQKRLSDAEKIAISDAYARLRHESPDTLKKDIVAALAAEYGVNDRSIIRALASTPSHAARNGGEYEITPQAAIERHRAQTDPEE